MSGFDRVVRWGKGAIVGGLTLAVVGLVGVAVVRMAEGWGVADLTRDAGFADHHPPAPDPRSEDEMENLRRFPAGAVALQPLIDATPTGGTLVLDHGFGISSNFLHLSRIDVKVGDRIEQGQNIAAVGATGRATGPHLHWGMNWFDTRIDPLLVLERSK